MEPSFVHVVLVLVAALFSFLFSGMEAGVAALSRLRVLQQQRAGRRAARVLQSFLNHPENFLWTILIGNTLATFTLFGVVIWSLHAASYRHPVLFLGVFVVVAFFFFVFCDLLPKMIFQLFPNRLSLAAAIPFRLVHLTLSPLTWLVERISAGLVRLTGRTAKGTKVLGSRRELRWFMQEAGQNLTSEERTLINRVLDLHDLPLGRIATPMENTTTVPVDAPLREAARLCQERDRTRLPVWKKEGRQRRIVGVVSLRNFLYETDYNENTPVERKMTPPLFLRQEMRVEAALRRLQRSGQRIAIVVGPDQREIGVVTLRDILKAIFGEVNL